MQPIAGYNYGAKQYPRVTKVLKITIYVATLITTIGFLMGMLIPDLAVSIFTTDEELVRISAKGLRIVVMFFPIVRRSVEGSADKVSELEPDGRQTRI